MHSTFLLYNVWMQLVFNIGGNVEYQTQIANKVRGRKTRLSTQSGDQLCESHVSTDCSPDIEIIEDL